MTPRRRTEPEPTGIEFPAPEDADEDGIVAVGDDLRPGTVLEAYRQGIFPWPHNVRGKRVTFWFSPDPRAHFPLRADPHWSRSLRRKLRTHPWRVTVDTAFESVVRQCAFTRADEGTWITNAMVATYAHLHALGHAHSVEVWEGDELVGGIYGVRVGSVFAGESMFHTRTDASKVAFAELAMRLHAAGFRFFDVQVMNPHLESLGCVEIPREEYLERFREQRREHVGDLR